MQTIRIGVVLTLSCMIGCSRSTKAVDQDLSGIDVPAALAAAEKQAQDMGSAFVAGDLDRLADKTHPRVVEMIGGREKFRKAIEDGFADMKAKGQEFHSLTVGKPEKLVRSNFSLFAIIPQRLVFKTPQGKLWHEGCLIAVSSDEGRTWTFVDGAGAAKGNIEIVLPDFPKDLQIPKFKKPQLIKDGD